MTNPAPVLHVDWFQMVIKWVDKYKPVFHKDYTVKNLEFGTRHFKLVQEVYRKKKRIVTLASRPHSGILDSEAILAKFDNWVCYDVNFRKIVTDFLKDCGLHFVQFSRVDFCADFNLFDNGMHPKRFIRAYVTRKTLRVGKSKKVRHTFSQCPDKHSPEGIKFGSNLSEITCYLYDKSLELKEVKWKPYIFKSWEVGGLNVKEDVWRLEFSLKSGSKLMADKETGELTPFLTLEVMQSEILKRCFFILYQKYWHFVWNDNKARKDRMRTLKLFKCDLANVVLIDAEKMSDADRSKKIFIKKLHEMNNELRGRDFYMSCEMDKYKHMVISDAGLQSWAMNRGLQDDLNEHVYTAEDNEQPEHMAPRSNFLLTDSKLMNYKST